MSVDKDKSFTKRFNLKDFYDSCEPEIPYDNIRRRSDLKIFSSNNPNLAPVYIEFYVTHASDEEKLHNGERIIEVKIESEEDIERITTEGFIQKEHIPYRDDDEEENNNEQPSMDISFYGFKSEDRCADNIGDLVPPVAVFWYRRFTLSDFSYRLSGTAPESVL